MPALTPQEEAHARSIGDQAVSLAPIPPQRTPKLLIGAVVRKPAAIVKAFLAQLSAQQLRRPAEIHYYFVGDFGQYDAFAPEAWRVLEDFAARTPNVILKRAGNAGGDFTDTGSTHAWSPQAWHRVGNLKNGIIQTCLTGGFEAVWLVDADVLCDPWTLQSLMDCEVPIVAGVYWTHWQRPVEGSTEVVHAGPQVWLRHPYILSGHGYSEPQFRRVLIDRGLLRVWGLGACTLFHRSSLEKGVHFTPVTEGLPPGPMSDGEDRHLCERARRLHLPLYADAWPDIWHCYHADDIAECDRWQARLSAPRPVSVSPGDLVSARLDCLEPIPQPQNPQVLQQLGPQFWRGRIGTGQLLPELEEAVVSMKRGERRIVTLHYPAHYDYPSLRSQQRLVACTLLDAKLYRVPPTIERELMVGRQTGAWMDATTLTAGQITDMAEMAVADV